MKIKRITTGLVAAGLALSLGACGLTGDGISDPSLVTLRYEKGPTSGAKFVECLEPGSKLVSNDKFYPYPATQRQDVWDSDNYGKGSKSADHGDLTLTDKDGNTVNVKVSVSFFLNTDCSPVKVGDKTYKGGTLQAFHELIGKTRHAYFNEDGTYGGQDSGWIWAMDNYISSSVTDYLGKQTRTQTAETLFRDPKVTEAFASSLKDALPDLVNAGMETDLDFYKDFSVKIYKITPDDAYLALLKQRQAAQFAAQTAKDNADAQVTQAEAATKVAAAQAATRKAEIAGYGSVEAYLKAQAIEKGQNPFQPGGGVLVGQK